MTTSETRDHYEAIRNELLGTEAIANVAASQNPTTEVWDNRNGFEWSHKESNPEANFATMAVTHEYGKTVGWEFTMGRDFSRDFSTDISSSIILNKSAAKLMGFDDPIEGTVTWGGEKLNIIGVIEDMVMTSPYEPVKQMIFYLNYENANFINVKIKPGVKLNEALTKAEGVFKKYSPSAPFDYKLADQEYELKFASEERIGQLANLFAALTIFISCLGVFGLASFIAEQRTKEIGIRKILGASIFNLWSMLSKDFLVLVMVSCFIAIPISYYFLEQWLLKYEYHTGIAWWMFGVASAGALVMTLLTVSFQAIKAATVYPINSLRTE
jgi:ABC-type antimicrobial peptide transport system permease subunit